MSHVFLSYASRDRHDAIRVARELGKRKHVVWVDATGIPYGDTYREAIDKAIRGAKAVLILITPHSAASPYVTYEWSYALGCGVRVIPVMRRQSKAIHPRLEVLQYVDAKKRFDWKRLITELEGVQPSAKHLTLAPASDRPRIFALFKMNGKRPLKSGREYEMIVGTRNVPEGTRKVRYEIVEDDTVEEPIWTIPWGRRDFETDDVSLYGDVYMVARGKGKDGPWSTQCKLSDALVYGHGRQAIQRSPELSKALNYIRTH